MSFIPKVIANHVRDSIRVVDPNTWLIGPLILRRTCGHSETATWYDPGDDASYTIIDAPAVHPHANPVMGDDSTFKLVYDAGDATAVWSVGNSAYLKVKLKVGDTTQESTTIAYVRSKQPSFAIPRVLYEKQIHDRYYLVLTRVEGRTLAEAWPSLDERWKTHYVNSIADICSEMASWQGENVGGVDGKGVPEAYLNQIHGEYDFTPEALLEGCQSIGMDCSKFVFYHADLGPGNIIVEDVPTTGSVGIVDWELAGFFPKGWIRTKFRISSGLNLPEEAGDDPNDWRRRVQRRLGELGYEEHVDEWQPWCFQDLTSPAEVGSKVEK
ncbi:uncharacterized protein DSM5745_06839 [Aspergillus mulundensis]|uniref:Aminoglycoside phosphotransferase domain-containing protein n=1 Tax=Aspergillus mulundensis TaxID=1810919 RepID=A0A3D8RRX7_9EURO|nr:Uncharacterized protein DSM5745_06839 [Aspergillus mulundensis]RDW76847.1 Uncharacterized protein DSM5745_06839 [Aspergillus mulundensis]